MTCDNCAGICWTNGCTGPCSAPSSCAACAEWCSQSCKGGCGNSCNNSGCGGDACTSSCGTGCGSGCSTTCKNECKDYCNVTCESTEAQTIKNRLKLTRKFSQENIQDIADLIFYEAARRPETDAPKDLNFQKKEKILPEKIQTIIDNLSLSAKKVDNSSVQHKAKALKSLGETLIEEGLEAYGEKIPIP